MTAALAHQIEGLAWLAYRMRATSRAKKTLHATGWAQRILILVAAAAVLPSFAPTRSRTGYFPGHLPTNR